MKAYVITAKTYEYDSHDWGRLVLEKSVTIRICKTLNQVEKFLKDFDPNKCDKTKENAKWVCATNNIGTLPYTMEKRESVEAMIYAYEGQIDNFDEQYSDQLSIEVAKVDCDL